MKTDNLDNEMHYRDALTMVFPCPISADQFILDSSGKIDEEDFMSRIVVLAVREILDFRLDPTVEIDIHLASWEIGKTSVPPGDPWVIGEPYKRELEIKKRFFRLKHPFSCRAMMLNLKKA